MRLRRFSLLAGVLALAGGMASVSGQASAASCPWMNTQQSPAQRATALLGAMSLSDKIQMVTGEGEFNPTTRARWRCRPRPRSPRGNRE